MEAYALAEMIVGQRRLGVAAVVVIAAMAGAWLDGAAAKGGRQQSLSPCGSVLNVATWSPSGNRIAFVGTGFGSSAICVADAGGRHAKPLRGATCPRRGYCRLINTPTELYWARPPRLVYGDLAKGIFAVVPGGKPRHVGVSRDTYGAFSVDAAGDRVAYGSPDGPYSTGPVTVLSVPSGRVVGTIGGTKGDNTSPSLSPDGKQVAFEGGPSGVSAASATGSRLRPLKQCGGGDPVWSPTGRWIACLGPPRTWPSGSALLLVTPQGNASITVVRPSLGVRHIFGWSPNGMRIAFSAQNSDSRKLDVVNLATDKVRQLLSPSGEYIAWSPDSRQLLVTNRCTLWRVPVVGTKKSRRLRSCS